MSSNKGSTTTFDYFLGVSIATLLVLGIMSSSGYFGGEASAHEGEHAAAREGSQGAAETEEPTHATPEGHSDHAPNSGGHAAASSAEPIAPEGEPPEKSAHPSVATSSEHP